MKTIASTPFLSSRPRAAAAMVIFLAATLHAADQTWNTAGFTDGNWNVASNWVGDAVPGAASGSTSGDTATFNGGANLAVTIDASRNIKNITFDTASAGAFTFAGGPLTITDAGAITLNSTVATTQTFNNNFLGSPDSTATAYSFLNNSATPGAKLDLLGNITGQMTASTETFTFGGSNGGTMSGDITNGSGGGNVAVTKSGAGTWTISGGGNAYTGATTLGGGTLVLSGGNNRLPASTTVSFTGASTLNIGATSQTLTGLSFGANVTGTITGSGGTLTLTGSNVNLGGLGATTLNATGLSNFTYNNASGTFGLNVSTNDATANVNLGGTVSITALAFNVGNGGPTGNGNGKSNTFALGQTNTIQADTINVGKGGANNGNSTLKFVSGQTAPTLTIRGTAGGTSRANVMIGQGNANTDYSGETGTINLTTGVTGSVLDARVGTLTLGYHLDGAGNFNNTTAGNFIFSLGTLDATTIKLATGGSPANKTSNGTLTVNGGTVKVQTLRMVEDNGGAAGTATVNINSGSTFFIQNVTTQASGTKIINWNDGTIRNYDASTDLNVASGVTINLLTAGNHVFEADAGRSLVISSALSGVGALTKIGDGVLSLRTANTFSGAATVNRGTLEIFNTGSTSAAGLIQVSSGATLGGGGSGGVTTVEGTLAPGDVNDNGLALAGLTLAGSALLDFELYAPNADPQVPEFYGDFVGVTSTLTLDGTLRISGRSGHPSGPYDFTSAQAGDKWLLMTYAPGSLTDNGLMVDTAHSPALAPGLAYAIETDNTFGGVYLVVAVPEPGTGILAVLGLLLFRRRAGNSGSHVQKQTRFFVHHS